MKKVNFSAVSIVFIVLAVASIAFGVISNNVEFHSANMEYIDGNIKSVMGLISSVTLLSFAISAIPGDGGMPIANQLVEMDIYFAIILCGLYLEKYLLILLGYLSYYIIIPVSSLVGVFLKKYRRLAYKGIAMGVILALVIPTSIFASKLIEDIYDESTEQRIEEINNIGGIIDNSENEGKKANENNENSDFWEDPWGWVENTKDDFTNAVSGTFTDTLDKAKNVLSKTIETIAVLIITSCIIPIAVYIVLNMIVKYIFNFDFVASNSAKVHSRIKAVKPFKVKAEKIE